MFDRRIRNATLIWVLSVAVAPSAAIACRCPPPSLGSAYHNADAVIFGTVVKVSDHGPANRDYRFDVKESWKQRLIGTIEVNSRSTCLYDMAAGRTYVVYLRATPTAKYGTTICAGNHTEADAAPALAMLRGPHRRRR